LKFFQFYVKILNVILLIPINLKELKNVKQKKNFKVAPVTPKPLQIQVTIVGPQIGITLNKLVITTAAQKLICAQTKT
jgi:hypothetical protein